MQSAVSNSTNESLLSNWKRTFFLIWTGQAVSLLGSNLVQFALVWWLTQESGSATVLATATLMGMLPQIFLGPLVGPLVDRWNRKRVMIAADGMIALVTVVLVYLFWSGLIQIWHIYAILFIRSLGGAFHWPTMQASTSLMVPNEHLARISGLNQALYGALNIVAPPLGALLLQLLPMHSVLSIDIFTALLAILPLLMVIIPQPARSTAGADGKAPGFWQDFLGGLRYVRAWPGLMIILVMAMLINFLITPAFSLMPLLVTKYFGGGVFEMSWMESAVGVGIVLGGVSLGVWGGFRNRMATSLLALSLSGFAVALVGLVSPQGYWLAVAGVFLFGFFNPIVNGPLHAVIQACVAPEMQGRVMTLISSLCIAMTPLSMLVAGPLSDQYELSLWYILGGVICTFMGVGGFLVPAVLYLEKRDSVTNHSAPEVTAKAEAAAD